MPIRILALESSCDETAASVISNGKLLNNTIASQLVHRPFGGVVPELASRAHERNIITVVKQAMTDAGIGFGDLDAVACTRGPGLVGSLLVGVSFCKGLALSLGIPLIPVNHMQAHVLAHFISSRKPEYPFLCLTVSGGHTQLVLMRGPMQFQVMGQTLDDAAGEAFDKAAKMLGLPYPGGPEIDRRAALGNPSTFAFPRSRVPALDFSFSGIKTALLYLLRDRKAIDPEFVSKHINDLCAGYQYRILDMLMEKLTEAARISGARHIGIAGGVAANSGLRAALHQAALQNGWEIHIPDFQYCTDNAAMVAQAAHELYLQGQFGSLDMVPASSLGPNLTWAD